MDVDLQWRMEMEAEERKRLAYFCFVADVQSSALQTQSASMSLSDLGLSLPCCPATWEADSAEQWRDYALQERSQPSLHSVLQDYQDSGAGVKSMATNALSHVLVLYGLIALFWQFERSDRVLRGSTDLHGQGEIQDRAITSFESWRTHFDAYCIDFRASMRSAGLVRDSTLDFRFRSFLSNTMVLYHTANAVFHLGVRDLEALNRASGPHHVPLNIAGQHSFRPSTSKRSSAISIYHVGHALREAALETCTDSGDGLLDSPRNVYTSLLVCCTFCRLHELAEPSIPFTHSGEFFGKVQDHTELWPTQQFGSAVLALIAGATISRDQLIRLCVGVQEYLQSIDAPLLEARVGNLTACLVSSPADTFI